MFTARGESLVKSVEPYHKSMIKIKLAKLQTELLFQIKLKHLKAKIWA